MRVLDAFRPQGATWSGQVISPPPGPSPGPFNTHLLPGGGVPRVHRARSPVPPRLPYFATPRSVHQFAAVAAGAYPPRRPPNAWSPGVPALPGPCYWLVASGTPVGWRGGCLALGLVRGAVRHYRLGGCSALVVCARRSRPVRGGWGRCRVLCLPRFPLPAPRFLRCEWRAVLSGCPLSSLIGTPFHAGCAFCGLGPVALLVFPACRLCVCAPALPRRPPPPLPGSVWRAHLARSRCWALVGPFHSVCTPPRVLPWSRALFGLLWGGGGRSSFPLACLGLRAPQWGGCGRGDPSPTPPRALLRAGLASWLCALWGRQKAARGGRLLPGCGASGVGRSPTPDNSSYRACGRGPLPTGCGCGGCGRGDPSPTAPRALLRAGFARCGGGTRAPGGGASCLGVDRPESGALRPPPLVLSGMRPGPTTHWLWVRGVRAWGPVSSPTARTLACWLCALWGRHEGARGRASLAWVWGVRGRALSHPRPLVRSGVRPGPTTHWLWVRGMRAWGPVTNPRARALASWLCTLWGRHVGARGGHLLPGCGGVRGRALSHPRPLVLSGVRPGPTTHWLWVRGVRAWGPATNPRARALACWLCALWGRHEGARGGAPLAWVWGLRGRALFQPRPLVLSGVRPGPTIHWLWVRGVRAWGPVTNLTARAYASWLCALWGRHEGAQGGRLLPGCGASGDGRSPTPDLSSFRACGRGPLPTGCGCGGCGRGDPSPTSPRALLRAGLARCGGGTRAPWGGASCLGVRRPGTGALPSPTSRPFGRAAGARLPLAVGAVCARGGPAVLGTFSCAAVCPVLCALPGFAAPGGRCGLAPVLVPWLWPAASLSGVPLWPCVGAPRLFPSGRSRCSGRLSSRRGAFLHPGGCRLLLYWVAARGTWRPAENQAICACCWPLPRQGRSARSASYPFRALRLRSWAACAAVVCVCGPGP